MTSQAWRYLPTLRQSVPQTVPLAPILEVATPDQARLHIVAAVFRAEATVPLRIEQFAFTQHNATGDLKPEGAPALVLQTDLRQPFPSSSWDDLRRRLASPGAQTRRPKGIGISDPSALIPALSKLAEVVRNSTAAPSVQVDALASLIRGIDDPILFESRRLAAIIDALADGDFSGGMVVPLSGRRSRVVFEDHGDSRRPVLLSNTSDGWVLTEQMR